MARTPWKMYPSACEIAKKLTLDFKLNSQLDSQLTLKNFSKYFFFNANSKSEKIFHFTPCVYLAFLRSYSHLNIVKYIGMYENSLLKWPELCGKCIY